MKRVLLIGFDPAAVDFLDPALPPGMTAEKIHAGMADQPYLHSTLTSTIRIFGAPGI